MKSHVGNRILLEQFSSVDFCCGDVGGRHETKIVATRVVPFCVVDARRSEEGRLVEAKVKLVVAILALTIIFVFSEAFCRSRVFFDGEGKFDFLDCFCC